MTVLDYHKMLRRNAAKAKDDWQTPDEYVQMMESCTHLWNEDACAGFAMLALKKLGADDPQIAHVISELYIQIDDVSQEEAAKAAKQFFNDYFTKRRNTAQSPAGAFTEA